MEGETEASAEDTDSQREGVRERSTIQFPYIALPEAVVVAKAIFSQVGLGQMDDHQLAAALGISDKSSGYRVRLTASRLFGLLETVGSGIHKLTALGLKFADSSKEDAAKVEAFLNVPLFKKVFEEHKGQQLPPAAAIERMLVQYGVAPKQKERARQVLEKSAQDAGFFSHGKGRLIRPTVRPGEQPPDKPPPPGGGGGNGGGGENLPPELDPIIKGLIVRLPKSGEVWPKDKRKLWLQILENSFDLVYRDNGESTEFGYGPND